MKEFEQHLLVLDQEAEELGALPVRRLIANVLDDMTLPAGKDNARLAIPEIRAKLDAIRRPSQTRSKDEEFVSFDLEEASA